MNSNRATLCLSVRCPLSANFSSTKPTSHYLSLSFSTLLSRKMIDIFDISIAYTNVRLRGYKILSEPAPVGDHLLRTCSLRCIFWLVVSIDQTETVFYSLYRTDVWWNNCEFPPMHQTETLSCHFSVFINHIKLSKRLI